MQQTDTHSVVVFRSSREGRGGRLSLPAALEHEHGIYTMRERGENEREKKREREREREEGGQVYRMTE